MADKMTLILAAQLQRRSLAAYSNYLEECRADAAAGHRSHYCEHGANQWVDWDVICGACEDGITAQDGVQRRKAALAEAHRRMDSFHRICSAMTDDAIRDLLDTAATADRLRSLLTVA